MATIFSQSVAVMLISVALQPSFGEPEIGEILADIGARCDVPAPHLRPDRDDATVPDDWNGVGLGEQALVEAAQRCQPLRLARRRLLLLVEPVERAVDEATSAAR